MRSIDLSVRNVLSGGEKWRALKKIMMSWDLLLFS